MGGRGAGHLGELESVVVIIDHFLQHCGEAAGAPWAEVVFRLGPSCRIAMRLDKRGTSGGALG
jgi:hypothetical protein